MKTILITQRVHIIPSYQERRDCLDQRWFDFLSKISCYPILVPNNSDILQLILNNNKIDGVILTGGNNLVSYGGDAPERDHIENILINYSVNNKIPIIGVCRGMQMIQNYFKVNLERIENHVATKFLLKAKHKSQHTEYLKSLKKVNSYCNYGSFTTSNELDIVATNKHKTIFAIEHTNLPIWGQMWHPERENPFNINEINFFKNFLLGE
jgi:N5-(cytidine 5'-diphosphoramidyl)-L-glutamine hydrolase